MTFREGKIKLISPPLFQDEFEDDLVPKMPDIQEMRQSGIKLRKKSPEDLINTVNRKYQEIFGQGDLVNLIPSKDTSMMDVEDFMRYL